MLEKPDINNIEELFRNDFFRVPGYQREYVWENDHVDNLLEDIQRAKDSGMGYYFIGNLVLNRLEQGSTTYDIVDGQQRLTTIYLILTATLNRLKRSLTAADDTAKRNIKNSIDKLESLLVQNEQLGPNRWEKKHRVEPQYMQSKSVVASITDNSTPPIEILKDSAASRIYKAYTRICDFLNEKSEKQFAEFWFYLLRNVSLISIVSDSRSEANTIFERINSRGQTLDPPDLVKNRILEKTSDAVFVELSDKWKSISEILDSEKESYSRFLRYFLVTSRSHRCRENEVLEWFDKNAEDLAQRPKEFLQELENQARNHVYLLSGRISEAVENQNLMAIRKMSKRARQHLFALLPLYQLPDADRLRAFDEVSPLAEGVLFASSLIDENTTVNEKRFIDWSMDLSKKGSAGEVIEYAKKYIKPELVRLKPQVEIKLRDFSEKEPGRDLRRYVISKIVWYIESQYQAPESVFNEFAHYWSKNYQIEHILAQEATSSALMEFGDNDIDGHFRYSLGNITLLESPLNSSIKNGPYKVKSEKYRGAKIMVTRALGGSFDDYEKTLTNKGKITWRTLTHHDSWTPEDVDKRLDSLVALSGKVWPFE